MDQIPPGHQPLRVNQLDALDSDDFIYDVILEKLRNVLKYLKISTVLTTYKNEVEAIIKSILWMAVFRKQNATLGQEMLELSYTSVTRSQVILGSISKLQSVLYVLCTVVLPYISAKLRDRQHKRDFPQSYPRLHKILLCLNSLWCSVNLMNFLVFLYNGQYLHMYERLCGIRTVHVKGRALREIGFEFSNREILWHAFAEFMVFVMPYINMRKIKNVLSLGGDKHQFADSCAICDSWPTNPQQFTDCKHLFCYHCIAILIASDGVYECKSCDVRVTSISSLLPAVHQIKPS